MSDFQGKIIKEYEKKGYLVLNVIRLSDNGYPDLIVLKNGVAEFIECKEKNDTLKALQKFRIDQLIKQGFNAKCLQDEKGIIYPHSPTNLPKG